MSSLHPGTSIAPTLKGGLALLTFSILALLALSGCVSAPEELRAEPEVAGRFYEDPSLSSLQARVEEAVTEEIRRQEIPALQLAIYGERERIELAFGTESPQREEPIRLGHRFRIGGVTKLYTAVIILSLVEEGRVSLEQSVEGWFPQLPGAETTTLRTLLGERSRLEAYTGEEFVELGMILRPGRRWEREELLTRIRRTALRDDPGSGVNNNSDYALLGLIAERVTGAPFSRLLQRYIGEPLGLDNTVLAGDGDTPDLLTGYDFDLLPFGNHRIEATNRAVGSWAYSAGGIVSTAGEMASLLSALHEGRLLSREMVELMRAEALGPRELEIAGELFQGRQGSIPGFGALLYQWPEESTTIAIVANRSEIDHSALLSAVVRVLDES